MRVACKDELVRFLKEDNEKHVVVMPDFFLDRIVSICYDVKKFAAMLSSVTVRKGGSIDEVAQEDIIGGNAVNTASALAALGAKVTPIVCTDEFGLQKIKFLLSRYRLDLSYIKTVEKASVTTALEFGAANEKRNVMLRDLGSLTDFGPSNLDNRDYELIEDADYVCLFNWAGTRKFGTELAETVFNRTKTKGKGKTYFDTADPTPNREKILELVENVLKKRQVDILSLNENEAISYGTLLDEGITKPSVKVRLENLAMDAARILAQHLSARIDLHTTAFSATFAGKKEITVPAFKIRPLRATGAGDAWNAGNILGDGSDLSDEGRLTLANAVSACYLTDPHGLHPTREKLSMFIQKCEINQPK